MIQQFLQDEISNRKPGCYPLGVSKHYTHKLTSHATLTEKGKGACGIVIALLVFPSCLSHIFMKLYTKFLLRKAPHLYNFF